MSHFCFAVQSRSESWAVINRSMKRGKNRSLLMLWSPRTQSEEVAGWSLRTLTETDRMSRRHLETWTRENSPVSKSILFLLCGCSDIPPPVHEATDRSAEASSPADTKRWRNVFNVGQLSYRALFSTNYSPTEVGWADIMAVEMSHNVAPCVQRACQLCFFSWRLKTLVWFCIHLTLVLSFIENQS